MGAAYACREVGTAERACASSAGAGCRGFPGSSPATLARAVLASAAVLVLIIVSAGQAATRCRAAYYRYSENGTRQYVQAMIGRRRRRRLGVNARGAVQALAEGEVEDVVAHPCVDQTAPAAPSARDTNHRISRGARRDAGAVWDARSAPDRGAGVPPSPPQVLDDARAPETDDPRAVLVDDIGPEALGEVHRLASPRDGYGRREGEHPEDKDRAAPER